ncbi:hypothetical protein [Azohydromonas aeria]|uniref:hypothetical protein n=1 Tax=Azohydromonas aeria TaxID=2590212 RepID=UPI0012F84965|nr:hypothetical protein [Azohydromonas aeria]
MGELARAYGHGAHEPLQLTTAQGCLKLHRLVGREQGLRRDGAKRARCGQLDALLDSIGFEFEGFSGSSADAMNAVAIADDWARGGRAGARQALAASWSAI